MHTYIHTYILSFFLLLLRLYTCLFGYVLGFRGLGFRGLGFVESTFSTRSQSQEPIVALQVVRFGGVADLGF